MAATIAQIRDAVQTTLSALDVAAYDVATGNERLARGVALVFPRAGAARTAACDKWMLPFTVEIHVDVAGGLAKAQDRLDALVDPLVSTSVLATLDDAPTLGGVVDTSECLGLEAYSFANLNGANTLAARFVLRVWV